MEQIVADQNFVLPTVSRLPSTDSSSELSLRPGEVLVRAGDPIRGCVVVKSGRLKRIRVYRSGEFLHGIAGAGDYLSLEETMPGGSGRHRETLEAIGDTVVAWLPAAELASLVQAAPASFVKVVRSSIATFHSERFLLRPIELLPVRSRVAATLWLLAARHATHDGRSSARKLELNLTREEVAHLAGTVYESVIRTLTSLKKEGVLDLNGRTIQILNEVELARIGQIVISETHDENTLV